MAFWLTNPLFYADTNDYLARMLKAPLDYILAALIISGGLALWSVACLVWARPAGPRWLAVLGGVLYGLLGLVYLALFYGSFWLLFRESPIQAVRLRQLAGYARVILDPLALLGLTLLAGFGLRAHFASHEFTRQRQVGLTALAALALLAVWAGLLASPPDSVYTGELPDKPKIIAHRGASFLAPENTLAAMERAVQLGAYGLETDLHISQDGIPFLMHDDTLARTTDVAAVFPGREKARAESFTLAEVQRLNAGEWFVQRDPYKTIASGAVSAAQAAEYRLQQVPTLAEVLEVVKRSGLVFIFDLKQPPEGHPYNKPFFELVFRQIHAAGIDPQVWFLASGADRITIRAAAPEMKLAAGIDSETPSPAADLLSDGYQVVNGEYSLAPDAIHAYQAAGLWVNLYTVDEPWQFSRLWLLGVDSITTSNAGEMAALARPLLALSYPAYLGIWIGMGLLALALVLGLALWGRRRHENGAQIDTEANLP